eukprot:312319-Alexandrium_andersonii.AAC.1
MRTRQSPTASERCARESPYVCCHSSWAVRALLKSACPSRVDCGHGRGLTSGGVQMSDNE